MARDVRAGLLQNPKSIPMQYYYDDEGSDMFQQIMHLDTYYVTNCEYEIFEKQTAAVLDTLSRGGKPFRLVELGAGDGLKTKLLLKGLLQQKQNVTYMPIDISQGAIDTLTKSFNEEMPELDMEPVVNDFFVGLHHLSDRKHDSSGHKAILFVGSTLGNMDESEAVEFLSNVGAEMTSDDRLLIGVDLKKDPGVIMRAYDDPGGVSRSFNMNLLERLNRELGANFDLDQWVFHQAYNPITGSRRTYLVSCVEQEVTFGAMNNFTVTMGEWEPVWTAVSNKYDTKQLEELAAKTGFRVVKNFYDERKYFVDSVWERL